MKTVGIVLIVAGILMMVFRGFNFTHEEKVVDVGPLEINKKEKERVNWPLYAGVIATVSGVIVVVAAGKRK